MIKIADLRQKNDKELVALLADTRTAAAKLVVEMRTQKVPNVKQLHAHKRTIARIQTVIRERELTKLEESHG